MKRALVCLISLGMLVTLGEPIKATVAADPGYYSVPKCREPVVPAACSNPISAGAPDPLVPAVTVCSLSPVRLRIESCFVSNTIVIPPGGGIFVSANLGVFTRAAGDLAPRLLRMPGQSTPPQIITSPTASAPKLIIYRATETTEPISPEDIARISDQSLAQVRWGVCETGGPSGCDNPPASRTNSFLVPITLPGSSR